MNYFNEEEIYTYWRKKYIEERELTEKENTAFGDQIYKTLKGVFFTHAMYRFGELDDCISEAFVSVLTALKKYDPNKILKSGKKPSLFNYISLTGYRSMQYYTIRQSEKKSSSLDVLIDCGFDPYYYDAQEKDFSEWSKVLKQLIEKDCRSNRVKEMCFSIAEKHEEYFKYAAAQPTRNGFYRYANGLNLPPHAIRRYFEVLKKNKDLVFSLIS